MKKLILFVAMLVLGIGAATAQDVQKEKGKSNPATNKETKEYYRNYITSADPQEVAQFLTGLLADKLALTAEQSAKVKEINETRLVELQGLLKNNEGVANKVELKGLEKRYNADLKGVLSAKQYANYKGFVAKYKD